MKSMIAFFVLSAVFVQRVEAQLSCDNYEPLVCLPDLKLYCLANGTRLSGTCDAQQAICTEGAPEATDFSCCLGTATCQTYNGNAAIFHGPAVISTVGAILFHLVRSFVN